MKIQIPMAMLTLVLCSCVTPIADFPIVSMTQTSVPHGRQLTKIGPVEAEYCTGDKAQAKIGDMAGLMDEVILIAQKQKKANYISDAHFGLKGSCIELQGTAMK